MLDWATKFQQGRTNIENGEIEVIRKSETPGGTLRLTCHSRRAAFAALTPPPTDTLGSASVCGSDWSLSAMCRPEKFQESSILIQKMKTLAAIARRYYCRSVSNPIHLKRSVHKKTKISYVSINRKTEIKTKGGTDHVRNPLCKI